jgi:hypothetical protein
MSTDLVGGFQQPQGQQPVQQQPVQQPIQQAPQTTPQIQYAPINPQTGQVVQQPPQQQQVQQQQVDQFSSFRNTLAQAVGVSVDQIPSDPAIISNMMLNGIKAVQYLRSQQAQQYQSQAQVQQQQVQPTQQTQQQQLTEKPLPPSWETMIARDPQTQQWVPTVLHPYFQQVAQDKNWNDQVRAVRQNTVVQGGFLPEHEQTIQKAVDERMAKERERWESDQFMTQYRNDLFEMGPDGSPAREFGMDGQAIDKLSPLGVEFNIAAQELEQTGQFQSKAALAKMAIRIAKDRQALKQANQKQAAGGQSPPAQVKHDDLTSLFAAHKNTGAAQVANINGHQQPTMDFRTALQRDLANIPDGKSGLDYLRHIRGR